MPIGNKIIKCEDCGCEVEVNSKDTETNRCKKCYKEYRKKYKNQKEKQRRLYLKSQNVDSPI